MTAPSITQRLAAEAAGTALLLAIVVGSGVMGAALAGGNDAIALLGNTLATAAGLIVLILVFGQVSGAHFNPAVTVALAFRRELSARDAGLYLLAQLVGGFGGVALAHAMFDLPILQASLKDRSGGGQMLGEMVATFGLILTILGVRRARPDAVAVAVGLWIAAGYWFTSSTSFANPAVTVARALTDSFAGIRAADAPGFVVAQLIGAIAACAFATRLFGEARAPYRPPHDDAARPLQNAP